MITRESLRFNTICYDIYTRLVRQRTSLSQLSTISHDFCTTSDVFWNKKEFLLLNHGHYLILPRERNKYDATVMIVYFQRTPVLLSGKHYCP